MSNKILKTNELLNELTIKMPNGTLEELNKYFTNSKNSKDTNLSSLQISKLNQQNNESLTCDIVSFRQFIK